MVPHTFVRQLLTLLGYTIKVERIEWLQEPYTHLVSVQHFSSADTVLIPVEPDEDDDAIVSVLLEGQPAALAGMALMLPWIGGMHEPGVRTDIVRNPLSLWETQLERVRREKKDAIIAGHFDKAAELRAHERVLMEKS